ncbi:SymE family type I addiction module toxin [Enterobacillus tribolii]|nr:type I toxin-antitoxin system SymE family toxin [Enterobacillus tribolii]
MTRYYSEFPSLNLKGDWLAALGFCTGQPMIVTSAQERLVIEAVDIQS